MRKQYIYLYSDHSYDTNNETSEDYNGLALGVGLWGKWGTKRGFIAEVNLRIGRNLLNDPQDIPVVGRGGITIGKRF